MCESVPMVLFTIAGICICICISVVVLAVVSIIYNALTDKIGKIAFDDGWSVCYRKDVAQKIENLRDSVLQLTRENNELRKMLDKINDCQAKRNRKGG